MPATELTAPARVFVTGAGRCGTVTFSKSQTFVNNGHQR